MKAVIMAGGKGTRLRPLTWHLPKPMVPLLDRPCMEYIIDLLKRHGITEIAVTVQYLPQIIKNHFGDGSDFGVRLHFFEETTPLGTAGSVKNAAEFLDETFLVISGDALADFDLTEAILYHKQKQAIGTLVLTRVDVPIEYGVVMTGSDGRITRFLEKPSWSEVFSDTVNTGIYILEPDVLNFFEKGREYDFGKDLFPLLMRSEYPLYGHIAAGYWSDIGSLSQYRQTQFDMLSGLVNVQLKGEEYAPGVRLGESVKIHPKAKVKGPAFIGDGTVVEAKAEICPYSVVGRFNHIEEGAVIARSIVWNGNYIGKSASLEGTTLCNAVRVGDAASVNPNTVVGEKSRIGGKAIVQSGVKIWPQKTVGEGTVLHTSLIWGDTSSPSLFGAYGVSGIMNRDITPEFVAKVASAYGSCLGAKATLSISSDGSSCAEILKYSAISSLLAVGVKVRDLGVTLSPIARYQCRSSDSDAGLHIRTESEELKTVTLQFFDRDGLPVDRGMERKIENTLIQEDFARPDLNDITLVEPPLKFANAYMDEILSSIDIKFIQARKFQVVCAGQSAASVTIMQRVLEQMGCQVIIVLNEESSLASIVTSTRSDLGINLSSSGETVGIVTSTGLSVTDTQVTILQALIHERSRSVLGIPVTAPSVIERLDLGRGNRLTWTKIDARSQLEINKSSSLHVYHDAFYTVACLLHYLTVNETSLQSLLEDVPEFYVTEDAVSCPVESTGRVMRYLMEEVKGQELELIDGIKVFTEDGWALILPDSQGAQFKLFAESSSYHKAAELTRLYKDKIHACLSEAVIEL